MSSSSSPSFFPSFGLQLLNFYKMSFFFFSTCSIAAAIVLVPFNLSVSPSSRSCYFPLS